MPIWPGFAPEQLLDVVASLHEGLQVLDGELRYVYLNPAALAHARVPPEDLIGRTMEECYPGISATPLFEVLTRCLRDGASAELENEFRYPDGGTAWFELRIRPCPAGLLVLSIDVTERRRIEAHVRQSQKMDAVSNLAGAVAHDFNNLLSVISSYCALLLEDADPESPLAADLRAIRHAGQRGAELTRQLLTVSRSQAQLLGPVDLNRVIVDSEPLWRRMLPGHRVVVALSAGPLVVRGDVGQIEQILMNLAVNARDAMPAPGQVTVETDSVWLDAAWCASHPGFRPGRYGLLTVSDTGTGMDAVTQGRIFEPFFTTKPPGQGTGLGLSTVFGITRQSGGHVAVYSEPGHGASFRIWLPSADGESPVPPAAPEPLATRGDETILLVENDPSVREVAATSLARFGYRVLVADEPGHAVRLAADPKVGIALLLTDVVMPGWAGAELAEAVRRHRPAIRVLFMSGYTPHALRAQALVPPDADYVQKPLLPDALARRVRQVLDGAQRTSADVR